MKKLYLFFALSIFASTILTAQKFWLLTYEFPGREKTGIAGIKDTFLFTSLTNGVLRSDNEGQHWDTVLIGHSVYSLFANDLGLVVAGGKGKIYRSLDYGTTWDSATLNSNYAILKVVQDSKSNLYAIDGIIDEIGNYLGTGVHFSDNAGANWQQRNTGLNGYLSCDQITTDRYGKVYVSAKDENVSGSAGLFVTENQGTLWQHINVKIDGDGVITDEVKVNYSTGLSLSPQDTLYYSFDGVNGNSLVRLNTFKSINDLQANSYWGTINVYHGTSWWLDRLLNGIHFAQNGDWYSSAKGTVGTGGTMFSKTKGQQWSWHQQGLGLDMYGRQNIQTFYEKSSGKVFMVQYMDERVYWQDTSLITALPAIELPVSSHLLIYPNPANSGQQVNVITDKVSTSISIWDRLGRKISDYRPEAIVTAPEKPGLYFITTAGSPTPAKLLVQ